MYKEVVFNFLHMSIPPDTYGFILEHDYAQVRAWVLKGKKPKEHYLLCILEAHEAPIRAWVQRSDELLKEVEKDDQLATIYWDRPCMTYVEFCDQWPSCQSND